MLITCDESIDCTIKIVGSISVPFEDFFLYEDYVNRERIKNRVFGELKWQKLGETGKYYDFYLSAIKKLFENDNVIFHSNSYRGNKYKAGYALIRSVSWKLSNMGYKDNLGILFDEEGQRGQMEVRYSRKVLNKDPNIQSDFIFCEQLDSKMFNILQITDLLTGCVAYKKNSEELQTKNKLNSVKEEFIKTLEAEIDNGKEFTLPTVGMWSYNSSKRFQHYNLQ